MKKRWIVTLSALALASGAVWAAGPGGWGCDGKGPGAMGDMGGMGFGHGHGMRGDMAGGPDPERMLGRLDRALDLDESQRAKIAELLRSKFEQHRAQRPAMEQMMHQFRDLDPSDPDFVRKSAELASQRAAVMEAHMAERAEVMAQLWAILTPEQQEKFRQLRDERQEHRGPHRGMGRG